MGIRLTPHQRRYAAATVAVVAHSAALHASLRAEEARRRRRRARLIKSAALFAAAAPRVVDRADGGWEGSTLNGYLAKGDTQTYHLKVRATKATFHEITQGQAQGLRQQAGTT
jgi:hypothetical protein